MNSCRSFQFQGSDAGNSLRSEREDERLIAGIRYLLPGNFLYQVWIDDGREARFMIDRESMLTPRLGICGEVEYDTL